MKRITNFLAIAATVLLLSAAGSAQGLGPSEREPDFSLVEKGKPIVVALPADQVFGLIRDSLKVNYLLKDVDESVGKIISSPTTTRVQEMTKKQAQIDIRTVVVVKIIGQKDGTTVVKIVSLQQQATVFDKTVLFSKARYINPFGDTTISSKATEYLTGYFAGDKSPFAKSVVKDSNAPTTAAAPQKPNPKQQ